MIAGKYSTHSDYRSTNEEGFSKIPTHWTTKRVRFVLLDGADGIKIGPFGSALKLDGMVNNGVRVYGQENVIKKNFSLGKRRISNKKFEEMSVYKICPNDLLITMMGTSGKCELVPEEAEEGIIDSHLLRLRVQESEISPEFFRLLIDESVEIKHQVKVLGKGSIMHGLNSSIVKNLMLPLPDREEQDHIINFLDHETAKIDTLIEKQQQLIKLLKEKRQAVISHAVTKGLTPDVPMKDSGVEWLGEVPEHWVAMPTRYITDEVTVGIVVTPAKYYLDQGIECFRSLNVKENRLHNADFVYISPVSNDLLSKSKVYTNDILIVRSGQPGTAAVVTETYNGVNCIDLIILRGNKNFDSNFLCYQINSDVCKRQVSAGSGGAIQQHFNVETAKGLYIAVPPLDEQNAITTYITHKALKFDKLIMKAEKTIKLSKERRTALISAAVTGKIDVRNWKPEQSKVSMKPLHE